MQCPFVNTNSYERRIQVDEDEAGGLRGLAEVLMNYGERHFDGAPNQRRVGMWANVLLMCGQFERVRQIIFVSRMS